MKIAKMMLAWLAPLIAAPTWALQGDGDQPFEIRAQSLDVDERQGIAVYVGDVVANQGSIEIRADRIEARLKDGRAEILDCRGRPARFKGRLDTEPRELKAEADRVVYRVSARQLEMEGHVRAFRGQDRFEAQTARYDLGTGILAANGGAHGGRVTMILYPAAHDAPR